MNLQVKWDKETETIIVQTELYDYCFSYQPPASQIARKFFSAVYKFFIPDLNGVADFQLTLRCYSDVVRGHISQRLFGQGMKWQRRRKYDFAVSLDKAWDIVGLHLEYRRPGTRNFKPQPR